MHVAVGLLVGAAVMSYLLLGETSGALSPATVEIMEEGAELGSSGLGLLGE